MKARIVHTKIWDDNWFLSLSRSSRLLFLYLITNQSIGLSGVYELPDSKIIYQTGLNSTELEQGKIDLKEKVGFYNGWVKIHNVEKYQQFRGPKNEKAKENEIKLVPKAIIDTLSIPYRYPIDSTSNQYSVISNKYTVNKGAKKTTEKSSKTGLYACTDDEIKTIAKNKEVMISDVKRIHDEIMLKIEDGIFQDKKYGKTVYYTLNNWVSKALSRGDISKKERVTILTE